MVKKLYSRKRRTHSRQHRKSMKGGGWFSSMFGSSDEKNEKEGDMMAPAAAPAGPTLMEKVMGSGTEALAATQGQLGNLNNTLTEVNTGVMAKFNEGKGALAAQVGNIGDSIKNMLPTGAAAAPAAGGAHQKGGKRRRSRHSKRVSRYTRGKRSSSKKNSKKHGKRSNKKTKRVRFSLHK